MTKEGSREHFFGFEDEVVVTEDEESPKAPDMLNKIDRGGGAQYGDFIEVWS